MGQQCDGGGNRDMVKWVANEQPLAPFFDASVAQRDRNNKIPCGVCSVKTSRKWAVCPRRLLTLDASKPSPEQSYLRERVLHLAGFQSGDMVQIWSEVPIRFQEKDEKLDYRLDYVLQAQNSPPVIVEIMTASTGGNNKSKRSDIQNAFCDAVLYAEGNLEEPGRAPSVNIRQVWARMASQIIVKSQIAKNWGGVAIWVVQDALADYIRSKTGLRLDDLLSQDWETGEVNVVSASLEDPGDVRLYTGPVMARKGEACWAELLHTPVFPPVRVLRDKLAEKEPIARIDIT